MPEVEGWVYRLRSAYHPETGEQVRPFAEEESAFIFNEVNLGKWDFEYWARRYCTVSDAGGRLVKLIPTPSQEKMLKKMGELEEATYPTPEGKVALIIAKARRVGATVLAEAAVAHNIMLRSQAKGLVASNEPGNSLELFKILTRIHVNLPRWMQPKMTGKVKGEHLYFEPPLDSDISIGHGNQKTPMGQGIRLDAIHLSEMSTWMAVGTEQVDADMLPAFHSSQAPTTFILIESTGESAMDADGAWFKTQYQMAKKGKGDFRSVFLSWYDRPDIHTAAATGVEFNEKVQTVADRIKRDTGYELTKPQMAWYQLKREQYEEKGNLTTFLREYPSSDDECFMYSLPCAWTVEEIDKVRNDLPQPQAIYDVDFNRRKLINQMTPDGWDNDPNNRVIIFEPPKDGFTYVVGVDAAYGQEGKDSSAIFVNRVGTRVFPDKQVAEFWSQSCSPMDLAYVCWILGHIYTDRETGVPALMAVEANPGSPGIVTQAELQKLDYPNFYTWKRMNSTTGGMSNTIGWFTTGTTRPMLTKQGVLAIKKGDLKITSPFFMEEMKTFINYGFKARVGVDGYEYFAHAVGEHDDRIFAGFIAYVVSHEYSNLNVADERRKFWEHKLQSMNPKRAKVDFQNSDITWEEAMEQIEDRFPF